MFLLKILLLLAMIQFNCVQFARAAEKFRQDYTYVEETASYYKFHTHQTTWIEAKKMCALEGASLFISENKKETNKVIELWKKMLPITETVYVGISDLVAKNVFDTVDGRYMSEVYDNWALGEPSTLTKLCVLMRQDSLLYTNECDSELAYICKKLEDEIEWNTKCNISDHTYTWSNITNKCYKFHTTPMTWEDAYAVCAAEQSYLAIINNKLEAELLVRTTASAPKDKARGSYLNNIVLLGFHDKLNESWITIRGALLLGDSGYSQWAEPNEDFSGKCGAMTFSGLLTGVACDQKGLFICEHDVQP